MSSMIDMQQVSKVFPLRWGRSFSALREITLQIEEGEAFGFIGQNGAGKSTTIKILTGALQADSGAAFMNGRSVSDPAARQGVGYVPENPSLYDYLTPYEILCMGVRAHQGKLDAAARKRIGDWLERFALSHVADKRVRTFSKGMQQRTALAHALALSPRLLILDEPLSGLDPIGRRDVVDVLAEFRRNGGTIFFSSHVLHDVERLADRFGLIHRGELKTVKRPAELSGGEEMFVLRSEGEAAVQGMVREVDLRWQVSLPGCDLWPQLEALRAAGHRILEVRSMLTLEQVFLQYVEQDQSHTKQ